MCSSQGGSLLRSGWPSKSVENVAWSVLLHQLVKDLKVAPETSVEVFAIPAHNSTLLYGDQYHKVNAYIEQADKGAKFLSTLCEIVPEPQFWNEDGLHFCQSRAQIVADRLLQALAERSTSPIRVLIADGWNLMLCDRVQTKYSHFRARQDLHGVKTFQGLQKWAAFWSHAATRIRALGQDGHDNKYEDPSPALVAADEVAVPVTASATLI